VVSSRRWFILVKSLKLKVKSSYSLKFPFKSFVFGDASLNTNNGRSVYSLPKPGLGRREKFVKFVRVPAESSDNGS